MVIYVTTTSRDERISNDIQKMITMRYKIALIIIILFTFVLISPSILVRLYEWIIKRDSNRYQ